MAAQQFVTNLDDENHPQQYALNATSPTNRAGWAGQGSKMPQDCSQPVAVSQQFQQPPVSSNAGPLVPLHEEQQLQPQLLHHHLAPPPAPICAPAHSNQHNQQYVLQFIKHHLQQATPPVQHTSQKHQHQQPRASPRVPDGKILILFALKGVLTDHAPARQEGKCMVQDHVIRPQIEVLLRLLPHAQLGIYSSATRKTMNAVLDSMRWKMMEAEAAKGVDGLVVPPVESIFPIICDRSSCQSDPHWRTRADGQEGDSIKPLGLQGFDLRRTILVDNDHYKSADGEADNMFPMPQWQQDPVSDKDLPILVELLLQRLKFEMYDVRLHLESMRQTLLQLRQQQQPQQQQDSEHMQQSQEAQWNATSTWHAMVEQPEQQPQAAAAAAAAIAAPANLNKVEEGALDGALAYKGFQVGSLVLEAAPTKVQQLIQVLTQYAANDASTAAAAASTIVDISKLLSVFVSDGSSSEDLVAAAAATYQQHVANVLLAAVWTAGFCVPDGYRLELLLQTLSSKGFPTENADRICDVLLSRGNLVAYQPQQQQLRFTWPLHSGHWPVPSGSTTAATGQQQCPSGSSFMSYPTFHTRLKNIPKAAASVRALLDQGSEAVEAVLTGYGTRPLQPGDDGYSAAPQQLRPAAAKDDNNEQQPGAAAVRSQWPVERKILLHNPVLEAWKVVVKAGFKDLSSTRGVLLEQLLMFIQGFKAGIAQQLVGDSPQQRLRALLEGLAAQPAHSTLLRPTAAGHLRRDAALGLLIESQTADECWTAPVQAAAAAMTQQQQQRQGAADSRLQRYFCNVVPEPEAVAQSLKVLSHAAATASAQQQQQPDNQVLLDQLWQQLLLPAAPAVVEVQVGARRLADRVREVVKVMNVPPGSQSRLVQEVVQQLNKALGVVAERKNPERKKRRRGEAAIQEEHELQPREQQQQQVPPLQQKQQQPPENSDDGGRLLPLLVEFPGDQQQQQQQVGSGEDVQRQQHKGFNESIKQDPHLEGSDHAATLPQPQPQQQQQLGSGKGLDHDPTFHRRVRQRRIEQQPGLPPQYQGSAGLTDEEELDQAKGDADLELEDLYDADEGRKHEAEAILDALYTANELALAQGHLPGGRPLHNELVATAAAAAASNAGQQQQMDNISSSSRKTALHHELLLFAAAAAPCAVERLVLKCALSQLQQVAQDIWPATEYPAVEAVLFGSQATGLALPASDLDVVLLETSCRKTKYTAEGDNVKGLLYKLRRALIKKGFADKSTLQVIDAKVCLCKGPLSFTVPQSDLAAAIAEDDATGAAVRCPILATVARDAVPCIGSLRVPGCVEVVLPVDLSVGVADGAAAVSFMTRQVLALPPLRPLVLVIKAMLKEAGLNEVYTGGLSSYSLVNMVVAHLQAEGMKAAQSTAVPVMSQEQVQQHLTQLAAAAAAAVESSSSSNAPLQQQWDLGCLLHAFFLRFSEVFNYKSEAVSVTAGGIISKCSKWKKPAPRDGSLAVEDPQQPAKHGEHGTDIAGGSWAIEEAKAVFAKAADSLTRMVQFFEGTGDGRHQVAAAAEQLLRKKTSTAAATVAGSSANATAAGHSADLTGLTEHEQRTAVQAEGQSVSVPSAVVQQYQVQHYQQQQQYEAGHVMLTKLMDLFGALGRGAAAKARRQQLSGARRGLGQQQVQQIPGIRAADSLPRLPA